MQFDICLHLLWKTSVYNHNFFFLLNDF